MISGLISRQSCPSSCSAFTRLKQVGFRERVDEFRVGKLLDVGDGDFDDRPQIARQRGPEVSAEPFMQRLEGAHLVFADAFGAFEVVDLDVGLVWSPWCRRPAQAGAFTCPLSTAASRASTSDWSQHISQSSGLLTENAPRSRQSGPPGPRGHYRTFWRKF